MAPPGAHSFLNEVLDRRLGIPITLSIVYVEVGRRAGLRPEPVAFRGATGPGHFLAKHELPSGDLAAIERFFAAAPEVLLDQAERDTRLALDGLDLVPAGDR